MKYLKVFIFLSLVAVFPFISEQAYAESNQPTITYHNLKLDEKTTTDSDLPQLLNNVEQKDIDFFLTGTEQDPAYFQYDFSEDVTIVGEKLTGWWPTQQGISQMKLQYLDGAEWKDLSEIINVDWRNQGNGPETINIGASQAVNTRGVRVLVLKANHTWSQKVTMREMAPVITSRGGDKPLPADIALSNLKLTNGRLDYLTNNPENKDIDFQPEKDYEQANTFLEYSFSDPVYLNELNLIGWYPKDQGIKNLSIDYLENGVWKSALANTELPWKTSQGTQKQEELTVGLEQGVITSKLRLNINSAYQSWGKKLNMRLIKPNGIVINSSAEIQKRIDSIKTLDNYLVLGNNFGEYHENELNTLAEFGSQLKGKVEAGIAPEEMPQLIKEADTNLDNFYNTRNYLNPNTTPTISFENANLEYGQALNLIDHQLATSSDLKVQEPETQASIDFDFNKHSIFLTGVIINCNNPTDALNDIQIQAHINGEWQLVGQRQVSWKKNEDLFAGVNIPIEKVATSKIRLLIDQPSVSLSEISFVGKIE